VAEAFNRSQDLTGRFGPFEGPGILVVAINERADIGFKLPDGGMNTSAEPLSGEFSEPALDLIDPRRRSRREVNMIMRPAREPRLDLGGFMGGIVIHDDMDIEPFGDLSIDFFEEVQELGRPMTLVAFADDEPRGHIECGKQRGRTMPHVAVRATFGYARHHRQDRLLAIECLDLALLIDAEDKGSVGRGKIKADDIAHLVDEQRIVRQLETFGYGAAAGRTPPTSGGSWCGKSQFPPPLSGLTSVSRRLVSCATSARSRQQPDRRR